MWTLIETTFVFMTMTISINCGTPFNDDHSGPAIPDKPGEEITYVCGININGAHYGTVGRLRKMKSGTPLDDAINPERIFPLRESELPPNEAGMVEPRSV